MKSTKHNRPNNTQHINTHTTHTPNKRQAHITNKHSTITHQNIKTASRPTKQTSNSTRPHFEQQVPPPATSKNKAANRKTNVTTCQNDADDNTTAKLTATDAEQISKLGTLRYQPALGQHPGVARVPTEAVENSGGIEGGRGRLGLRLPIGRQTKAAKATGHLSRRSGASQPNTLKTMHCGECTLNRNNCAAKAVPRRLCRQGLGQFTYEM
jgi:hypothetical protein